ncbi:MAG TPA: pyridoxamine 5'-phosphate oxidase family protein [Methylomirabilota bacterium]|nr:pyridoxamine 5'-phosphate oxidase family protein [Methylomirabilota bacterium]
MKLFATILTVNVIAAFAATAGVGFCTTSARDSAELAKSTYIYIATVRKDGNQSKAVPVWFIPTSDSQVLIETGPGSWKAKRIKRGSPALVWIGSRTGPAFIGKAEIVQDKTLQDQVIEQYPKKYWQARLGFARPSRAKLDSGQIVVIRITPARDLPGFASEPGTRAPTLDEPQKK